MSVGWARTAFRFAEYYRTRPLDEMWMPPRLRTREWMFIGFDDRPPERHRGFTRPRHVLEHVVRKVPMSVFYSTAYYTDPNQRSMRDKGWRGADLIFDLDGDHLPGVTDGDFPAMLEVIQEQAWSLWTDFLEPEYGFDPAHLQVTFSGHRGFHLHYRAPDIWELDGNARREFVSHIKGEGVDVQTLLSGPDCAWRRRVMRGVETVVGKLDTASRDDAEGREMLRTLKAIMDARMKTPHCDVKSCGLDSLRLIADKAQDATRRRNLLEGIQKGELRQLFGPRLDPIFRELVKGDGTVVLGNAGETDEAVTLDIKRVIRWPTSLHGKCGMRVTEIPLDRLDPDGARPFDALSEAIPWRMGGEEHAVRVKVDGNVFRVGDTQGTLVEGEVLRVDEATSTFLVLKGWAEPVRV